MRLTKEVSSINGFVYMCRVRTGLNTHKTKKFLTTGSFFENSKLKLKQLLELMYFGRCESQIKYVELYMGISKKKIIVQWYQYFRDVCSWKMLEDPLIFGGVNQIVQCDESKFMKLTYNRGNHVGILLPVWYFEYMTLLQKMFVLK
jgi:hypothetical protein